MTITAQSPDSYLSQALTDLAAIVLVELNQKVLHEKTFRIKKFLELQTEETRSELESLEKELVKLQQDKNVLATSEVLIKMNGVYVDEKSHMQDIKRDYKAVEMFMAAINFEISQLREEMASDKNQSQLYLSQAQRRFELLKYQMAVQQIGRQPSSTSERSEDQSLKSELEQYKTLLRHSKDRPIAIDPWKQLQELESLLAETKRKKIQLSSEIKAAENSLAHSQEEHRQIPEVFRQISELQRSIRLTTEIYTMLKTRLAEAQIQEAGRSNDLLIMSYAERSRHPTGVGTFKKGMIGGIGGFTLSIMSLFLIYSLIPTIRNKNDLERLGMKVVGEYSVYRSQRLRLIGEKSNPLVLLDNVNSPEANAIRYTRFRIERALNINRETDKHEGRVISSCSVNSDEGKTFSLANLAYSFAMADLKTLLIDCDFEKSDLHHYFDNFTTPEELSIVNDDRRIKLKRHLILPRLHLINGIGTEVTANSVDYLESSGFHVFLQSLRDEYDVIFLDGPPMKGHLTPVILAKEADAVLFIVNQRISIRDNVTFNFQKLRETFKGPIFGILNFMYEDVVLFKKGQKRAS